MSDPFLSIVVCTYNRASYIIGSLQCLAAQTADPSSYEVIVVDNNSTDNTAALVQNFLSTGPANMRYAFEGKKGLSEARNRGVQEARGEIIAYVDDDAEAVPGYASTVIDFFKNNPDAVGGGGRVIPKYEDGKPPSWMNHYLNGFVGAVDFGNEPRAFDGAMKYPAGCNMQYRKKTLQEAGGFNNQLTFRSDDKYIFYKVQVISSQIWYLPGATVYHHIDANRLSFSNFRKLFLKTGNEEKVRIRSEAGAVALIKKLIEYCFKFAASLLLYLIFIFKGQEIKGRYVLYAQWFTLQGFLMKNVFVR